MSDMPNNKARFVVIEKLHMPSGRPVFEVVEDDDYLFTSKGHFFNKGDAYCKAGRLNAGYKGSVE